jgi:hypothetical protein
MYVLACLYGISGLTIHDQDDICKEINMGVGK